MSHKKILLTCAAPIVLLLICFSLICLSTVFPNDPIKENVKTSCEELSEEGLYPCFLGFKLFQMDNYTDVIMLEQSVSIDSSHPIISVMKNTKRSSDDFMRKIDDLKQYLNGDTTGLHDDDYSRYWHGYLIILRPLLMFFTIHQIRIINYIVFFSVLTIVILEVKKIVGLRNAYVLLFSLLCVALPLIPYNLQFSCTFYIALFGILYAVNLIKRNCVTTYNILMMFFVIGGITSYFDLFTIPIVTIGLPIAVLLTGSVKYDLKSKISTIVMSSLTWSCGYAWIWVCKWIIGGIITGTNVLQQALLVAGTRTTGSQWKGMDLTIPNIVGFIWKTLLDHHLIIPLSVFGILFIVFYIFICRGKKAVIDNSWLLIIAMMPLVWYFVMREHSIQHGWFTWRALSVTIFSGVLFIINTVNIKKVIQIAGKKVGIS